MEKVIQATRQNNQLVFFCVHCRKNHYHGLGDGHRWAHCDVPWSPYAEAGYCLEETREPLDRLKDEALHRGFSHELPDDYPFPYGWPYMTVKVNRKTTHISWSEKSMDGEWIETLQNHYRREGIEDTLWKYWDKYRNLLSPQSEISTGGVHGAWTHCPNEIAGEIINIVRVAQEDFVDGMRPVDTTPDWVRRYQVQIHEPHCPTWREGRCECRPVWISKTPTDIPGSTDKLTL